MLYRRCDNSDGPVSDRKSRYILGRPGKPVGAICVSLVPRQGRNPLYPPIRIEKFVPSLRSELNIPIGSAACKPPHLEFLWWIAVQPPMPIVLRLVERLTSP